MDHNDPDDDDAPSDPWDEWLRATMEWEGGLSPPVVACPDIDEPDECPDE